MNFVLTTVSALLPWTCTNVMLFSAATSSPFAQTSTFWGLVFGVVECMPILSSPVYQEKHQYQYLRNCTSTPPPPTQLQSTDKKLGFILSLGRSRCAVAQTLTLIQKPFTLSNNEYIFTIKKKSLTHRATCIHKMPCLRKIHHLFIFLLPFKAILNNDNRVLLSLISRKGRIST